MELLKVLQDKIDKINNSVGLDASVLGEKINPKVFGIIRDLRGSQKQKKKLLQELEEEQFGGGELFWQPLKDFGLERLKEFCKAIPSGIQSGLKKGMRGVFFFYKYGEDYNLWYLYDIAKQEFITNKTDILKFIACNEEEKRVIPNNIDIFEIHRKVRQEIEDFFSEGLTILHIRTVHGRMEKTLRDMRDELEYIKEEYLEESDPQREQIVSIIDHLNSISFTKLRMRSLRRIWNKYKKSRNWHALLNELYLFLGEKPKPQEEETIEYDESKLRLICVDFIS